MTIAECMRKVCWRSMATPFFMFEDDGGPKREYGLRTCIGEDCMSFYTFEQGVHKDGGDFDAFKHKEEDKVIETHGFCKALFIEVDA